MTERVGEIGAVLELVYANGAHKEVLQAIHGSDLPPDGSEEKLDLLDHYQRAIEEEIAANGLAKALEDLGLNGQYVSQASKEMTHDEAEAINQASVLGHMA